MESTSKNQSPIEIMLSSRWRLFALITLLLMITFIIVVWTLDNPILSTVNQLIKPVAVIFVGLLMWIGMTRLYKKIYAAQMAKKYPLNQDTESPFVRTTMSEFVQRPTRWSLNVIREIEWKRFEDLSMGYYLEKGILAKSTSLGADGGIDIKLYQDESGEPTSLVQCKVWDTKLVGIKAVRDFLAVLKHEKVSKGFLMTATEFTGEAKAFAKNNKINLIDGEKFLAMILRLPEMSQSKLLALAIAGDYKTPTCTHCGVKMVQRKNQRAAFWRCQNYPTCHQKMAMTKIE
jgi:restriction system protein